MSGVFITLNQGVGASASKIPTKERMSEVQTIANDLRGKLLWLKEKGFTLDPNISLKAATIAGKAYEKSTIAYKFYDRKDLPSDGRFEADLYILLNAYDQYLQNMSKSAQNNAKTTVVPSTIDVADEPLSVLRPSPDVEEFIRQFTANPSNQVWLSRKIKAFDKWRIMFSPNNIQNLSREEFKSFLTIRENQSWDGIQRQSSVYEDITRLRNTISYLVNGINELTFEQIKEKLDNVLSPDGLFKIRGLDRAVVTAIMHICDTKNRLAVWNSKVDVALEKLQLVIEEPQGTKGERYLAYNRILNSLGKQYGLSLYQVDMLMHLIATEFSPGSPVVASPPLKTQTLQTDGDMDLPLPAEEDIKKAIDTIQETLLIDEASIREIIVHLVSGKNVILSGPVGTGKTHLAKLLPKVTWASIGGYSSLVFTATGDWATQDVIGGILPKLDQSNEIVYSINKGCVYETVKNNWLDDGNIFKRCSYPTAEGDCRGLWLVIDEFNRANIDRAFGEMFTAIEYHVLKVPTMCAGKSYDEIPVPKDFRIIGTLNSFDKHYLFKLSDALKRRFAFVEILPPKRQFSEKEKYYALKRSIDFLRNVVPEVKLNFIRLNHTTKEVIRDDPIPQIVRCLDNAYDILSFIRYSKNLGTASLIAIFSYILTDNQAIDSDFDRSLDSALKSSIIPQLENVPRYTVEVIREFCSGDLTSFLKSKNHDDFAFSKYAEEFAKLLQYLNKDEIPRRTASYKEGVITEAGWLSYNPWANKTRPNLPLFSQALDELIKELELM